MPHESDMDAEKHTYGHQHCYRPQPKDGEGNVFTGVCPSTEGGGTLASGRGW